MKVLPVQCCWLDILKGGGAVTEQLTGQCLRGPSVTEPSFAAYSSSPASPLLRWRQEGEGNLGLSVASAIVHKGVSPPTLGLAASC